jgi:hypothetical protein
MTWLDVTGDLRGDDQADLGPVQFRKADRASSAIFFVTEMAFPIPNFRNGPRQVAVPLQRVHGQVQMGIKDKHVK